MSQKITPGSQERFRISVHQLVVYKLICETKEAPHHQEWYQNLTLLSGAETKA